MNGKQIYGTLTNASLHICIFFHISCCIFHHEIINFEANADAEDVIINLMDEQVYVFIEFNDSAGLIHNMFSHNI